MRAAIVCPQKEHGRSGVYDHALILSRVMFESSVDCGLIEITSHSKPEEVAVEIIKSGIEYVIVAYTPFLYGSWNTFPVRLMQKLKHLGIKTLLFVHEIFIPSYGSVIKFVLHRPFHFWLDRAVLKSADSVVVTTDFRLKQLDQFCIKATRIPVYSNINVDASSKQLKDHVVGMFGVSHDDVMLSQAADGIKMANCGRALLIGEQPGSKDPVFAETGFLSVTDVSRALQRLQVFVVFDRRGISFRKGSAAAAFQHGIAVVANKSSWTDPEFIHGENIFFYDGTAVGLASAITLLVKDDVLRETIGQGGRTLYETYMSPENAVKTLKEIMQ
ncbi:MAG: hypothetical protein JNL74_08745 [Fibrobacteres bacterium]|nr:hypothetical protein [Fibrobacterota bacterium]